MENIVEFIIGEMLTNETGDGFEADGRGGRYIAYNSDEDQCRGHDPTALGCDEAMKVYKLQYETGGVWSKTVIGYEVEVKNQTKFDYVIPSLSVGISFNHSCHVEQSNHDYLDLVN